jgi:hypothetical protein
VTFPSTQLPVVVELDLAGDGTFSTDITSKTYVRDGITISRGRPDEAALSEPSQCDLVLNNRDGRFSPRKADGAYYGSIGRNTPLRVSITQSTSHLLIDAATGTTPAAGARVTTPDSANLSITGDIDLRFDADLTRWRGTSMDLVGKWTSTAGQKSYQLVLLSSGVFGIYWSNDGTTELGINSTALLPRQTGRLALRATLDVNNGAGGRTATFYTSDSLSGTWTQLGDAVTVSGTTSIFDSTTAVTVLDTATGSQGNVIRGKVYGAQVLQGIAGTVRASPDFTAQTHGATSFADAQSNTWTLTGAVKLSTRDVRFVGEVLSWPVTWDLSQRDVRAPIEATGVMRRLQAGAQRLSSTAKRALLAAPSVVAYWPMEDGSDATYFAEASGNRPMVIFAGSPSLASYQGFACSDPLPTLDSASDLRGQVPTHVPTSESQVRGLVGFPAGGTIANNTELISVNYIGGTCAGWQIRYGTGGALIVRAFEEDATSLENSTWAFGIDSSNVLLSLELTQNGADIDWQVVTWDIANDTSGLVASGTVTAHTMGRPSRVQWNPNGGADQLSVGHTVVQKEITSIFDRGPEMKAHVGEAAVARIARLCSENGVTFQRWGGVTSTTMGPQRSLTLMELLRECEAADGGILFEARDELALAYRCRRALYAQTPEVTLDYDGRHLFGLQPVEDDDAVCNDVTITRSGGASGTAVLESGPLSVQPPPNGIGRYPAAIELNVQSDIDLDDHASWRLQVGTADEARFPTVAVNLASPAIATSAALTAAVRRLEVGDRLVVEDPPAGWMPPEDISQIAVGFTEELGAKVHRITVNCTPESPYHVAIFSGDTGGRESRWSAVGTVTAEALDTTETGVDITTPHRWITWAHNDGDYGVMIGGELMTVTAISGTAPSYTLTVTRSANGIVKSHSSGAAVTLVRPVLYGL